MFVYNSLYQYAGGEEMMNCLDLQIKTSAEHLERNLINSGFYVFRHFPGYCHIFGLIVSYCSKQKIYEVCGLRIIRNQIITMKFSKIIYSDGDSEGLTRDECSAIIYSYNYRDRNISYVHQRNCEAHALARYKIK